MSKIKIFTDGAARGNPGPSAIGIVIEANGAKKTYREFIGYATNNEAEYKALIFALQKVKLIHGKTKSKNLNLECYLDSELIVKQLNHQYKVLEENIQKFFLLLWNLSIDFKEVKYLSYSEDRKIPKPTDWPIWLWMRPLEPKVRMF